MIGVVLWSDASDRKAVFWCEDHGDLAFYEQADGGLDPEAFFDAGDMVQFDVRIEANMRQARNARLVLEQACVGLPERLAGKRPTRTSGKTGTVVPFMVPAGSAAPYRKTREA